MLAAYQSLRRGFPLLEKGAPFGNQNARKPGKVFEKMAGVIETGTPSVVTHKEFGDITIDAGEAKKRSFGLKHIIYQRADEGSPPKEIAALLFLLDNTLKNGEKTRDIKFDKNPAHLGRMELSANGITAIVSKQRQQGDNEQWVLTGYANEGSKDAADAIKKVISKYGYAPEFLGLEKQVGAVTSLLPSSSEPLKKSIDKTRTGGTPMNDPRLAYFKRKMLEHLEKQAGAVEKAGYAVGTIREWKGKKFIKVAPGEWKPHYKDESRGAKLAAKAVMRQVEAAASAEGLMKIALANKARFGDKNGAPLPLVFELRAHIDRKNAELEARDAARAEPAKKKPREVAEAREKPTEDRGTKEKRHGGRVHDLNEADTLEGIRENYQAAKAVEGDEDEVQIGKEIIAGRWKLVEAGTPQASHDERTFRKTPGFPRNEDGSTVNDRDYEHDKDAQEIVLDIAGDFDGQAVSMDSPVIVTADGVVVSGNNRTMSSKIAARKGTDGKYIEALKKKAKKFGFTAGDVGKFKNPRVIFETAENKGYTTDVFAKFNPRDKKAMSPVEAAVKVSKTIKSATVESIAGKIGEFETMGDLYADKKAAHEIYAALERDGIINKFDRPQYITEGGITGAGKEFLETALIGSVISEANIRALNREGCKSIRQKLVRAIVPLVENKGMDGYSVTGELNAAVGIVMEVATNKDKFKSVAQYANQNNMFGEDGKVAVELAKRLEGTQKEFAEFMQQMNGGLKHAASGEADIFLGGVESREEILGRLLSLEGVKKALNFVAKSLRRLFKGAPPNNRNAAKNKGGAAPLKNKTLSHAEKVEAKRFLEGEPIAVVPQDAIQGVDNKTAKEAAIEWAQEYGAKRIKRAECEVVFDKNCVERDFAHTIHQNKLDSLPAVPVVLEKGKTLEISGDLDGKPIKNLLIAAPVKIGEKTKIVLVRARQHTGDDSRFYFHDVYSHEDIKKWAIPTNLGVQKKSVGLSRSITHIKNLLQDIMNVKSDIAKSVLSTGETQTEAGKMNMLDYFKRKMLEHLNGLEARENRMEKGAKMAVGTIRTWKGKQYIKIAPGKWKPKYDSHSRGAKMSIAALKRKVDKASTAQELMDIMQENRNRFSDKNGHPLPFVQELSAHIRKQERAIQNVNYAKVRMAQHSGKLTPFQAFAKYTLYGMGKDEARRQAGLGGHPLPFVQELSAHIRKQERAIQNVNYAKVRMVARMLQINRARKAGKISAARAVKELDKLDPHWRSVVKRLKATAA